MRKKMEIPEKERRAGETTLFIGIGALITVGIIAVLADWGYIAISLPH